MRIFYLVLVIFSFSLISCGGKGGSKKAPIVDTTTVDTAGVEQLEKELNDLEEKSADVHNRIDSINKSIDK